jgi:BirA family biotin operon repressor/biotin-[acetyl-CoA-carboxylase] ligase
VGDRLALLSDPAVARAFASALGTRRIGRVVEFHRTLPTTMVRAAELVRAGTPHGTVVVADHQTAGRGRRGRSWGFGPPGSQLLASWLLKAEPASSPLLVVLSAVALARAAESLGVRDLSVKWPNDLLLAGRKVAGVLGSENIDATGERWLVLGTGIDVHTIEYPSEVRSDVTSFASSGHSVDRLALLARIAPELEALVESSGPARAEAIAEWRSRSAILGRPVRVEDGARSYIAEALDLADDGALVVRHQGRIERVVAGDVSLQRV